MRQIDSDQENFRIILKNIASGNVTIQNWKDLMKRCWQKLSDDAKRTFENSIHLYTHVDEVQKKHGIFNCN